MNDLQRQASRAVTRTRAKITATLSVLGAGAGIGAGVALTYFGNVISGYPITPPLWHASLFGIVGAVAGPMMVWLGMRSVPLWRASLEPAGFALVAAVLSMLVTPAMFVPATIAAGFGAMWRLTRIYSDSGIDEFEPSDSESGLSQT